MEDPMSCKNQGDSSLLVVICAYNEEETIGKVVSRVLEEGFNVLVVDDGSDDSTADIALQQGATVIRHPVRMGKAAALSDAIRFAAEKGYEIVIEVDADAIPTKGSIKKLAKYIAIPTVGGVSALQIPVGGGLAYSIDELVWAILAEGKRLQQRRGMNVHLGAVMYGIRLKYIERIVKVINDDEYVGICIIRRGARTLFAEDAIAYFDASSSLKHLYIRRKRMIVGHIQLGKSTAPSMQPNILAAATLLAVIRKPSRVLWLLPAIVIEITARLSAMRDARNIEKMSQYKKWHTYGMKKPITISAK
jgi:glycosyltransferase involved in cell wall biosynthesis